MLVGEDAVFEAAASGLPAPTVQWQLSTDGGGTWSDVPGATAGTLTVPGATLSENDYEYQAVFTNEAGFLGRIRAGGLGLDGRGRGASSSAYGAYYRISVGPTVAR